MYKNDTFHLQKKRDLMKKSGFPLQRLAKTPVRHSFTFSAALDTEWPALFCTHVSVYVVSLWQIWRQRCCPFKLSFSICMSGGGGGGRTLATEERSAMAGSLIKWQTAERAQNTSCPSAIGECEKPCSLTCMSTEKCQEVHLIQIL